MFAAEQAIPNKIAIIRPTEHPWITCHIRNLIRKHKRTYRKFKRTSNANLWGKYEIIRNKIVSLIRKSRNDYFGKKRTLYFRLKQPIWNYFGKHLNNCQNSEKQLLLSPHWTLKWHWKGHFAKHVLCFQSTVVDDNRPMSQLPHAEHSLQTVTISCQEIKDVLLNHNVNKACNLDLISPRFLKEGAVTLASLCNSVQSFPWTGLLPFFLATWKCNTHSQERW